MDGWMDEVGDIDLSIGKPSSRHATASYSLQLLHAGKPFISSSACSEEEEKQLSKCYLQAVDTKRPLLITTATTTTAITTALHADMQSLTALLRHHTISDVHHSTHLPTFSSMQSHTHTYTEEEAEKTVDDDDEIDKESMLQCDDASIDEPNDDDNIAGDFFLLYLIQGRRDKIIHAVMLNNRTSGHRGQGLQEEDSWLKWTK
uniref:Uncharacterized protein n=1 Tax=Onchocerca volvulus TaxID=6282 RepID=A0A8R1Y097_ONCVO